MSLIQSIAPLFNRAAAPAGAVAADLGPTVKPVHELRETAEAWGLTVYLPGVAREGLEITAEGEQLRIVGRRAWQAPKDWTTLYRETATTPFELTFDHDYAIDVEKIHAELKDGVLRMTLPKAAALQPRRIAVQ